LKREGKIVGGRECFEGEFPWMISFKSNIGHFCGGFVVSERHVLSAAHCFYHSANPYLSYGPNG
jgi:secreted trypsin-like serine protease